MLGRDGRRAQHGEEMNDRRIEFKEEIGVMKLYSQPPWL
jgi:hypothetical protein